MGQTSVIRTTLKIKGDKEKSLLLPKICQIQSGQRRLTIEWRKTAIAHLTNIRLEARIC